MTIYVFSLLVGYEISGVDIAQGSREKFLKKTNYNRKYIFTKIPEEKDILAYKKAGIDIDNMLCAQLVLADQYSLLGECKVVDKIKEFQDSYGSIEVKQSDRYIDVFSNNKRIANIYTREDRENVWSVSYFESERLISTDYYSDKLLYRDYYSTVKDGDRVYASKSKTAFFNPGGQKVYECLYEGDERYYIFNDGRRLNTSDLMECFVEKLNLTEDDIVLIDRPSNMDYVQPLFKTNKRAKIMTFLHSGHYFELNESNGGLFLNFEYYYWFKYSDRIHTFLVSTEEQKKDMEEKLQFYQCHVPKIKVALTGGLNELKYSEKERKEGSIITVSRLDKRKRIDWIILAVIKAHNSNPSINLDIYGSGLLSYTDYLNDIITKNNAESYIKLKGHCDVTEVYKEYQMYVSASLGETLGLSLMEAVASGNVLIGLDVRYGNRLFIEHGKNGYLVDYDIYDPTYIERVDEITTNMADRIVEVMSNKAKLADYQKHSYEIAQSYLNENVEKMWLDLFDNTKQL